MSTRPEIFISAASKDLKSCRQLVRDAMLTLGCVPVVQDHFPPAAGAVRDVLRAKIAACDAVLHLAGKCYGFEPQEHPPTDPRRSYTQLEYDIARELKKPLYTFLCAPGFPYDAHEPEPEELRLLQEQHRAMLASGDHLYLPVKDSQELNLRVRELQSRVEQLSAHLQKTRSWLARGVAAGLLALALIGGGLWVQHRRSTQTEQKVAQVSDELDRYRQAVRALADNYGKDIAPGRTLSDEEKFERALSTVASQQKIGVGELKTWLALFVAQVRSNPGADFYDRALADFAGKHFNDASVNAGKAAIGFRAQREAAEKEVASANQREARMRDKERRAWTLQGDAEKAVGHYTTAVEPYKQAFALCDKEHEPLVWCEAAQNLAMGLRRAGRYREAERLAREVVESRETLLGPEHQDALTSVSDLALVLEENGDLAGAEPLNRRCMEARERTLGREHPDTLASVKNLANVLDEKGDYAEAEALDRRCLEANERTLGKENPDTLVSINNLANVFDDSGDHLRAEALHRRCLEARERTLGREYPDTLQSVSSLGGVLFAKGDYAGATTLYRRCVEAEERIFGVEHPATLRDVSNLAQALDADGDSTAAEPLYLRAEAGMDHVLPPEHLIRLDLDYHLSLLRQKQGRLSEAVLLAQLVVAGAQKSLPVGSPDRIIYEKYLHKLHAKLAGLPPR